MKKLILISGLFVGFNSFIFSQCPSISCPTSAAVSCTSGPVVVTATSNYSANITSRWIGPVGEPVASVGTATSIANLGNPGIYTIEFKDNSSMCVVTQTVTLINTLGVPAFSITGSPAFTLSCSNSPVSIQVTTVLTAPIPNVPINYFIGSVSVTPSFTANPNYAITSCGNYHIYIKDLTNNCISSTTISIACTTITPTPITIFGSNTVCTGSSVTYTATGMNTYTWSNGPNTSTNNILPLTNTACVVNGTDINGCICTGSVSLNVNNSCVNVWPGDANSDGIVNNLDVFEIGLANNQTGPVRIPTSNAFSSFYATAWTGTVSTGKNMAHADCNGDGVVNSSDNTAITNNFNLTHAFRPNSSQIINADLTIVPTQSVGYINEWNTAEIFLGSATNTISQIFGAAFEINIDTTLIENGSYINFNQSFLNNFSQNITFNKLMYSNQKHYITNVRTDATNVDGNGKIGEIVYKVKATTPENSILNLVLVNGVRINKLGISGNLSTGNTTLSLISDPNGIKEYSLLEKSFTIYPNPSKDKINITAEINSEINYILSDLLGRNLLEGEFKNTTTLNLSDFNNGTYIVKLSADKSTIYKKVIITK